MTKQTKRIEEKNRLWTRIDLLNSYIKKDSATIERLGISDDIFKLNQVKKLKDKNIDRENEVILLEKRINDVNTGKHDQELYDCAKTAQEIISKRNTETDAHKKHQKEEKEKMHMQAQKYYKSDRESDRQTRYKKKDIARTYKYYLKNSNSIPDYMTKKLNNMPNNKGYIWRGIYCYGKLPRVKGDPVVLFEKHKDVLIIHEWSSNEYKLWHKKGKSKKFLKDKKPIRNLNHLRNDIINF